MEVTKDTIIGDIIDCDEATGEFFLEIGMHCLDCPVSRSETIEEACDGQNLKRILRTEEINDRKKKRSADRLWVSHAVGRVAFWNRRE